MALPLCAWCVEATAYTPYSGLPLPRVHRSNHQLTNVGRRRRFAIDRRSAYATDFANTSSLRLRLPSLGTHERLFVRDTARQQCCRADAIPCRLVLLMNSYSFNRVFIRYYC